MRRTSRRRRITCRGCSPSRSSFRRTVQSRRSPRAELPRHAGLCLRAGRLPLACRLFPGGRLSWQPVQRRELRRRPTLGNFKPPEFRLAKDVDLGRLGNRRELLKSARRLPHGIRPARRHAAARSGTIAGIPSELRRANQRSFSTSAANRMRCVTATAGMPTDKGALGSSPGGGRRDVRHDQPL